VRVSSYSIDGIALQNPDRGWIFRGPSKPLSNLTLRRPTLQAPGLPGVMPDPDDALQNLDPPMPTLMVQTPRAEYETLLALFTRGRMLSITDHPGREAAFELLSTSHDGYGNGDEIIDVTATIQLPGVFWRDTDERTFTQALTSASHTVDLWQMTGLVTDAVIRVKAPFTGLRVESGSAWMTFASLTTGYLRYECATGRAYTTSTDTWTGGTAVGGTVDADGPGDKFGIFPTTIDPFTSKGRVVVTTATRGAGAQIQVRGKGAHLA
jgi:hypothetical protein